MVELKDGKCIMKSKHKVVATGTLHGALYILDVPENPRNTEVAYVSSLQLRHERLAHVNPKAILHIVNHEVVEGVKISSNSDSTNQCWVASTARAIKLRSRKRAPHARQLYFSLSTQMYSGRLISLLSEVPVTSSHLLMIFRSGQPCF